MFRAALFALFFALASAQPIEQRTFLLADVGDANGLIDQLLAEVDKMLPAFEPLPDIGTKLHLTNCFVTGLDSGISRVGDSSMTFNNGSIVLDTALTIANIGASCDWSFAFLDGTLHASTPVVSITTTISASLKQGSHPDLLAFKLTRLGHFDISMTGVSFMDKVLTEIAQLVVNGPLKGKLMETIDAKLPPIIEAVLKKIHI